MTRRILPLSSIDRRAVLTGLVGSALAAPHLTSAQTAARAPVPLVLRARPVRRALRPGAPDAEIWALEPESRGPLAFRRGDTLAMTFRNDLPVPTVLNWHGLDGAPDTEPLLARAPVPPGGSDTVSLPLSRAGTLMCDARLLGDGGARATGALALSVGDDGLTADRDETLLIEDWRPGADGHPTAPGASPNGAPPIYSVNGQPARDIPTRPGERLRFRFINGSQRNVIALKIDNSAVRVMAIDGRRAEPFPARDGQLVLAAGTRIDAVIDVPASPGSTAQIHISDGRTTLPLSRIVSSGEPLRTTPLPPPAALPSDGLPDRIDLRTALRVDLTIDRIAGANWIAPASFDSVGAPAFGVKRNRAVVLALTNRAAVPATFHLHGHHFRLLDRLDDGWKPFWLDTLAIGPGQTHRIAFKAETGGRWLMESMAADWSAPRLLCHYVVE